MTREDFECDDTLVCFVLELDRLQGREPMAWDGKQDSLVLYIYIRSI